MKPGTPQRPDSPEELAAARRADVAAVVRNPAAQFGEEDETTDPDVDGSKAT